MLLRRNLALGVDKDTGKGRQGSQDRDQTDSLAVSEQQSQTAANHNERQHKCEDLPP